MPVEQGDGTTRSMSLLSVETPSFEIGDGSDKNDISHDEELLEHGHRNHKTLVLLQDFVTHTIHKFSLSLLNRTMHYTLQNSYLIAYYLNCDIFSLRHKALFVALHSEQEPTSYSQVF